MTLCHESFPPKRWMPFLNPILGMLYFCILFFRTPVKRLLSYSCVLDKLVSQSELIGSCFLLFVKAEVEKQIGRQWHCPLIPSLIFPFLTFHYLWHRVPLNICPVPTSPWWYIIVVLMKLQLGFHQDVFLCFCDQETAARFPIWSSTLHQFSPVNIQFSGTCPLNNYYLLYFSINACSIQ